MTFITSRSKYAVMFLLMLSVMIGKADAATKQQVITKMEQKYISPVEEFMVPADVSRVHFKCYKVVRGAVYYCKVVAKWSLFNEDRSFFWKFRIIATHHYGDVRTKVFEDLSSVVRVNEREYLTITVRDW